MAKISASPGIVLTLSGADSQSRFLAPVEPIAGAASGPAPGPAEPRLIPPSGGFVVVTPGGDRGTVAPPGGTFASNSLIRVDDLLVMEAVAIQNPAGQVFVGFNFPPQHAAETEGLSTSLFDGQSSQPPVPTSAGPFGWFGGGAEIAAPIGEPSPGPASDPQPTTLWWSDLSDALPGTHLVFLAPNATGADLNAIVSRELTTLLDWSQWQTCVGPKAGSAALQASLSSWDASAASITDTDYCGALGMMFGMVFTLTETGAWTHLDSPKFGSTGRNELWHTRLVRPAGSTASPTIRAAWSLSHAIQNTPPTDLGASFLGNSAVPINGTLNNPPALYDGFPLTATSSNSYALQYPGNSWVAQPDNVLSLESQTRLDLVNYTTYAPLGQSGAPAGQSGGVELPADDVMLTAIGGSLTTGADFTNNPAVKTNSLLSLTHSQHLGRDITAGSQDIVYLAPFGQKAVLGSAFLRSVDAASSGDFAAVSETNTLRLLERVAVLPSLTDFVQPFQSVAIVTKTMPTLYQIPGENGYSQQPPGVGGQPPFMVSYEAIDAAGGAITFELPLQLSGSSSPPSALPSGTVPIQLGQQRVSYSAAANSTFETDFITLGQPLPVGQPVPPGPPMTVGAGFKVLNASVRHPAIAQFTGVQSVQLTAPWNPGGDVLAEVSAVPPAQGAPSPQGASALSVDGTAHMDRYGAFAAPKIGLAVLSKSLGAAGGDPTSLSASSDAINSIFGSTVVLGVFPLASFITNLMSEVGATPPLPLITSTSDAGALTVVMKFPASDGAAATPLSASLGSIASLSVQGLAFSSTTVHGPGSSAASVTGTCTLTSPAIQIPADDPLVSFEFNTMTFTTSSAAKPTASVDFNQVEFFGQLAFVNEIMAILPSSVFSNPPEITITDTQCVVECGVDFPSIGIGVFELANIDLDATLTIPFVAPTLQNQAPPLSFGFNFSTVDNPFTLSVLGFAGSGSFGITIEPNDVVVNGSLAFGGSFAIDVIVAQGWVTLQAGVSIAYTASAGAGSADIGGFVHLSGGVDVLDLVSATLDVMLSLDYDTGTNAFTGSADVTLSVDVLVFHGSVSFSVSESFGGSAPSQDATQMLVRTMPLAANSPIKPTPARNPFAAAPGFLSAVQQSDWETYCAAFAA